MKKLVVSIKNSTHSSRSIFRAFWREFLATSRETQDIEIQANEEMFLSIRGNLDIRMKIGYRQLWMYTMRHFPQLVSSASRKENDQPKPLVRELNLSVWFEFADLTYWLEFDLAQIQANRSDNPDKKLALAFLSNARFQESYRYSELFFEVGAEKIFKILQTFKTQQISAPVLTPTTERLLRKDVFSWRYGRPFEFDYEREKNCLFSTTFNKSTMNRNAKKKQIFRHFLWDVLSTLLFLAT